MGRWLRALPGPLLLATALAAQEPPTGAAAPGVARAAAQIVVPPIDVGDGWLELVPMGEEEAEPRLVRLGDRGAAGGELRLAPGIPPGVAMLCSGGRPWGVLCEQLYLPDAELDGPGQPVDIVVRFETGVAVRGRYLLADRPVAGARVAVVPAGLGSLRAFTMPLGLPEGRSGSEPVREVPTDADGRFELPEIAEGEYFLETLLPSGRVHRSDPFLLPAPEAVRRELGVGAAAAVSWNLGEIDVADGLVVQLRVTDPEGKALAGARIAGRQGFSARTLKSFEATTGRDGAASLSGFSVDEPVYLSCRKPGYRTFEEEYPLLPVLVACVLEPLATVAGEVLGVDGQPPAGAGVSVRSASTAGEEPVGALAVAVDAAGRFVVADLAAGEYELTAAAPGFAVERRTIALEPGQGLDLGSLVLLAARGREGRAVDADTGKPLVGVEVRAVSPPGAVRAVTGEGGAFTLATSSDEPLVLRLTAPDHAAREVTLKPEELEAREPLVVEMVRGGWIRAVVWDEAAGLPCRGCRLVVRPAAAELLTDGRGEALSENLEPGGYRVYLPRVSHLGSTVVEEPDAEYRYVRVERGRTSTARFGEKRRHVRVRFEPPPPGSWTLSARTPWGSEKVHSQAAGGYRVRHRRDVALELYLHFWDSATGSEAEVRQGTLAAGFDGPELVLPLHAGAVEGRATSDGEPLAGAAVRLRTLDHRTWATVHTRSDGTFRFPHLPAGLYAVVIGELNVHFASLRDGQTLDLGSFELLARGD